ncbi:MTOR-associated protein MEAK7 isoform X1 [Stegostoma tigrinum]|uniref:MTOR-associated protein MEAK7 isoform X1 n=2 Tax=Stegostoma tigrinum TaxID=3053191 RepID=UPI00287079D9|nr:MTOR-associated protein MEAK7 isoform X1 [Stegostoma tigrinum]XP_048402521.2 MTOR-associated protein MEAK7 isoform X1 [Stegostoma tigrinum]
MGNGESHGLNRIWRCPFSAEERVILDNVFDSMSGSKSNAKDRKDAQKQITLAMLKAYVHVTVQGPMTIRLYNAMRSIDPIKNTEGLSYSISKKQFILFLSYAMRGTAEEKAFIIQRMVSQDADGHVKGKQIKEFTKDLITTVIQLLHIEQMLGGWTLEKTADPTLGTVRLTNTLMSQLKAKGRQKLTTDNLLSEEYGQHELKDWMYTVSLISTFLRMFVAMSLHITSAKSQGEVFSTGHLLPECTGIKYTGVITVFDVPSVIYLNACLPSEHQHKWQLLFSSHFHGSSFTRFCSRILHKGPTLLVVKDADGYIFGGYASHSWDARPQFQGDSKCFLFTLCPQFGIYTCTGYNDHYMYLNHGQQTMPNGLGMGGQLYYFGLWIDSNYGEGHSKAKTKCTTYDSPQLSAQEHFKIDTLEVWSVGNPPDDQLARSKSVLDSEPEAQALLHMIGKVRMSDGLRDPNEDKGNK